MLTQIKIWIFSENKSESSPLSSSSEPTRHPSSSVQRMLHMTLCRLAYCCCFFSFFFYLFIYLFRCKNPDKVIFIKTYHTWIDSTGNISGILVVISWICSMKGNQLFKWILRLSESFNRMQLKLEVIIKIFPKRLPIPCLGKLVICKEMPNSFLEN